MIAAYDSYLSNFDFSSVDLHIKDTGICAFVGEGNKIRIVFSNEIYLKDTISRCSSLPILFLL